MESKWLSITEAAEELGLSQQTIRDAIRKGDLPAYQPGGKGTAVRILRHDWKVWIADGRVGAKRVVAKKVAARVAEERRR
jgi:excisionase family DNA binding protein